MTKKNTLPQHNKRFKNTKPFSDVLLSFEREPDLLDLEVIDPAAIEIGDKIRKLRLSLNITQTELANKTSVSQSVLSNIESGIGRDGPTYRVLRKILDALNASLDVTMKEQVEPNTSDHSVFEIVDNTGSINLIENSDHGSSLEPMFKLFLSSSISKKTKLEISDEIKAILGKSGKHSFTRPSRSGFSRFRCDYFTAAPHSKSRLKSRLPLLLLGITGAGTVSRPRTASVVSSERLAVVPRDAAVDVKNDSEDKFGVMAVPVSNELSRMIGNWLQ